jgi:flagellar biosynthesis chaperone FliJ
MAKKQAERIATTEEIQRLTAQSNDLRRLAKLPGLNDLSAKRYDKLQQQLKKLDRAIAKITKIVG